MKRNESNTNVLRVLNQAKSGIQKLSEDCINIKKHCQDQIEDIKTNY